jgi:hypothetical protein
VADGHVGRQYHHLSEPFCQIGKVSFECQGREFDRVCESHKTKPTIQVTGVTHQAHENHLDILPSSHNSPYYKQRKIIKVKNENKTHLGKRQYIFRGFSLFTRP